MKNKIIELLKDNSFEMTPYGGGEKEFVISSENLTDLADDIISVLTTDFETASRPLIKYLCENHHPHVSAIITPVGCQLLEAKESNPKIFDYIVD